MEAHIAVVRDQHQAKGMRISNNTSKCNQVIRQHNKLVEKKITTTNNKNPQPPKNNQNTTTKTKPPNPTT